MTTMITPVGRALLCALLMVPAGAATAEESLSLMAVAPYTAEFDFYTDGEGGALARAGTWSDRVSIDQGQLSRTVTRYTPEGVVDLLRTVVVDQQSLRPIRLQQRFGPELTNVYHLDFNGQALTQILVGDASRPARVSTAELAEPVVETGLQAVFTLGLPLTGAGEITVTTYAAGAQPQVVPKTFHIVGEESVEVMGKTFKAWRIEDRAAQWTYWVRREAPYIVKVVHPVPGGKMATSLVTRFSLQAQ